MLEVYKNVWNHQFYFSYFGNFSDDITANLIELVSPYIQKDSSLKNRVKKFRFLLQSVIKTLFGTP